MINHIIELKKRIIICGVLLIISFLILFFFSDQVYVFISNPILQIVPGNNKLIATHIGSTFFVPMKLCFVSALFLNIPIILYHIWAFISPGLYKKEKKIILPCVLVSCILFYLGIVFAFFVLCPIAIEFLTKAAPPNVLVMTEIGSYLDFIIAVLFAGGIAFEIPIVTVLLIKLGIVKKTTLIKNRPYIIVMAFVLGMLLTPPDVVSQIVLAVPMCLLFELGLLFSKVDIK